ncbi:GTPase family protein [Pseudomonas sp. Au-Pse12]|uniref:GTPase family protein n=1 Tax=Pseudomonas sp. Au-Pse12 TaxID=2906459 RepID=UPI001E58CE19|nr:GTPase [Pseudomonas sp. Au-Pse12]MCE4056139.1 50S ribosome-binding GTPase [Pseudomonas sp. Au-Pse12]
MGITKYRFHRGDIGELSERYPAFEQLKGSAGVGWYQWIEQATGLGSFEKMVLFIGKSGYGKSTTLNSLIGKPILETSDVTACTRECQSLDFHIEDNYWLSLGDLPGIGENLQRDKEYLKLYADFFDYASVIVHVLRADTRDYTVDEQATNQLINTSRLKKKVIYALGQCDKIEPTTRSLCHEPTADQLINIDLKLREVGKVFAAHNPVVPYSAETRWNMSALTNEIVRVALSE